MLVCLLISMHEYLICINIKEKNMLLNIDFEIILLFSYKVESVEKENHHREKNSVNKKIKTGEGTCLAKLSILSTM